MSQSKKFEKLIHRIHKLLESIDSEVTWNDHVNDPDNIAQKRQIDISIRKDNSLTLVECRLHKKRQDVKWIEELLGRRISLGADCIIAVSGSGFTQGAILKAKAYGIIIRDICDLSDEEVLQWGEKTRLWLNFYEYRNPSFIFVFDIKQRDKVVAQRVYDQAFNPKETLVSTVLNIVRNELDDMNLSDSFIPYKKEIQTKPKPIGGIPLKEVHFCSDIRLIKKEQDIPTVSTYSDPMTKRIEKGVLIERVANLGDFSILRGADASAMIIDLSSIRNSDNFQFTNFTFRWGGPPGGINCEVVGYNNENVSLTNVYTNVAYKNA